MEYFITKPAEIDLNEIWDYIACDNKNSADKFVDKLFKAFERIAENPKIGHKRKDLTKLDVYFWRVGNYLIIYREKKPNVEILRVLSGYRDIASLLQ